MDCIWFEKFPNLVKFWKKKILSISIEQANENTMLQLYSNVLLY